MRFDFHLSESKMRFVCCVDDVRPLCVPVEEHFCKAGYHVSWSAEEMESATITLYESQDTNKTVRWALDIVIEKDALGLCVAIGFELVTRIERTALQRVSHFMLRPADLPVTVRRFLFALISEQAENFGVRPVTRHTGSWIREPECIQEFIERYPRSICTRRADYAFKNLLFDECFFASLDFPELQDLSLDVKNVLLQYVEKIGLLGWGGLRIALTEELILYRYKYSDDWGSGVVHLDRSVYPVRMINDKVYLSFPLAEILLSEDALDLRPA